MTDPLAPGVTKYFDQALGSTEPGAGGPVIAALVAYDPTVSGLVADNVQTALDLLDNAIDFITDPTIGLDGRVTTLEAEMDTAQADITALDTRLDAVEASITTLISKTGQATETTAGIAEIATQTETTTGTDDATIVTPLKLSQRLQAYGNNLPQATETVRGAAEIATQAEVNAGADDLRMLTPKKLHDFTGMVAGPLGVGAAAVAGYPFSVGSNTAGTTKVAINAAASNYKAIDFLSAGVVRWQTGMSDIDQFYVARYDAAGVFQGSPLIIDTVGRVGIAVTPVVKLHVYDPAYAELRVETGAGNQAALYLKNTVRTWEVGTHTDGSLLLHDVTGTLTRMQISTIGQVGIGVAGGTAPQGRLHVKDTSHCFVLSETSLAAGAAAFKMIAPERQYDIRSYNGAFEIWDDTAGVARLGISSSGLISNGVSSVVGMQLLLSSSTACQAKIISSAAQQAILHLQNTQRQWGVLTNTDASLLFYDYTGNKARMSIDTNGVLHLKAGSTIAYDLPA
jgi:hypothetical protein